MLSFLHQVSVFSEELRRENVVFKIKTRSWCVSCQYKASISCSQRVRWGTLLNLGGIGMDYRGCRILAYWGSMCVCGGGVGKTSSTFLPHQVSQKMRENGEKELARLFHPIAR